MRRLLLWPCLAFAAAAMAASVAWAEPSGNEAPEATGQRDSGGPTTAVQPATMTGEWGGLRTRLREDGIDISASYGSQTAWNISGGKRELVRESGQFALGAKIDTEALIGLDRKSVV